MVVFTDDADNYHHLLTFEDVKDCDGNIIKHGIDDARALLSLLAIAVFMNALDKRTYMPFKQGVDPLTPDDLLMQRRMDINAIPLVERRHFCFT